MAKKIFALITVFALVLSLSACTHIFRKEHLYVTKYTDAPGSFDNETISVSNYAKLKSSVKQMIADHRAEAKFIFSGYDSDLQSDLSQLGWDIKSEDALAAFCVDYISYNLNPIVTYYEAPIHITYKRTAEEVSSIVPVAGLTGFRKEISAALSGCKTELVVQWVSRNLAEDDVVKAIMDVYYSDSSACVVSPDPKVTVYNSATLHNIVEIEMCYGYTDAELQTMKAKLAQKINKLASSLPNDKTEDFVRETYNAVTRVCEYDPDGRIRASDPKLTAALGSTAYGALTEGCADSLGMALAFCALCKAAGVKCSVVHGSYNQSEHWWNIVAAGDSYLHIDVTGYHSIGLDASCLRNDAQMQASGYQWETANYPHFVPPAEN